MEIHVDSDECTGCKTCELICAYHRGHTNPRKARPNVVRIERVGLGLPIICVQYLKLNCVESCAKGALEKDRSIEG